MGRFCGIGFVFVCCIYNEAFASHAVGADLSYQCISGNQYRITLNFYRDCSGVNAPNSPSVTISSASCGQSFSRTLFLQSSDEVEVLCPGQINNSTCNGGSLPGIEQYIYSRNVTLPAQCTDWVISYDLCCRNAAITNLFNPGNQDLYVEARLNNTGGFCNSSPVFTKLPVPYICTNQQVSYNHGAIDANGDSLVYTSINPLHNPSSNIPYVGVFNPGNPLFTSGGFSINALTGQIVFTPSSSQNAVITVKVDEYRNGVLIGSTMRDMQFVIIPCGNNLPTATGVNGTLNYTTTFCSGQNNCFTISTNDANASQILTLNWNNAIAGATFTTSGSPRPTGTFCWTPGPQHVGDHNFLVTVQDNACPLYGSNSYAYTIYVERTVSVSMSSTPLYCYGGSNATATATASGGNGSFSYLWNTIPPKTTATITGLKAGTYIVTVTDASVASQCGVVIDTVQITEPAAISTNLSVSICYGDSVVVGNSVYQTTGSYLDTLSAYNGCDSIITTSVQVFQPNYDTVNILICPGESFSVGASVYVSTGTYVDSLISASGCDSIIQTNLAVKPESHVILNSSICPGDFVIVGTSVYSSAGSYVDTLVAANGCDSIVTLNLTVLPIKVEWQNISVCLGESVTVGSSVYHNAGTFNDVLVSSNGCDSVVLTTVTVRNPVYTTINPIVCLGDSITVGASVYNTTGTYQDTLVGVNGCDSVVTTNLTVIAPKHLTIDTSICNGENFAVGSSNYSLAGTYVDSLTAADGCDSIVQLNLSVRTLSYETINVAICQGENFVVGSSVYSSSGNYIDTLIAANGCDSIVTLNLSVLPVLSQSLGFDICQGDSVVLNGNAYYNSGTYHDTLIGTKGCDSILIISVTVHNPYHTVLNPALCYGETFTIGSMVYDSTGIYVDSLITIFGCDSIVTTNLTIADSLFVNLTPTICDGETFRVGNSYYSVPGTYYDTIGIPGICDSIVRTDLIVLPLSASTVDSTICYGEVVVIGTSTYSSSGTYLDTLTGSNGCDSMVTLNLTVQPISIDTLNADICEGDSVIVGSSVYHNAGTYVDTLIKTNGCDSIIVTSLTVRSRVYHTINPSICLGETFVTGGSVYSSIGTYRDTLVGYNGCDSVITTSLNVINPKYVTLNPSICYGENFMVGSSMYSSTGTYFDTLIAASGCDSIIQTNLVVKSKSHVILDSSVCAGEFVIVGTSIYTGSGSYVDTVLGSNGCDSIVTLNLTVLPIPVENLHQIICDGDSVVVGNSVYYNSGTYNDVLIGSYGCDSVVITTVIVRYPTFTSISPVLCLGETVAVGNSVYSSSGTYSDTLVRSNGCDSVITTNLTVINPDYVTIDIAICYGEHFSVGNSAYSISGIYVDTLIATTGCDSIVTLNLAVLPVSFNSISSEICENDSFVVGNSVYRFNGTYRDTLVKSNGCDSIVEVSLVVHPLKYIILDPVICESENFTIGSSIYNTTGIFYDTMSSSLGCDSIIITNLTVLEVEYRLQYASICGGEQFAIGNSVYANSGIYADTFLAANGCDSIVTTDLTVFPVPLTVIDTVLCKGDSVVVGSLVYKSAGVYLDTLSTIHSCDSIIMLRLLVFPVINGSQDRILCRGDSLSFQLSGGVQYEWTPGNYLSCNNCSNPYAFPQDDMDYVVKVTDGLGCIGRDTIHIDVSYMEAQINLSDSTVCEGEHLTFTASFDTDSFPVEWLWNFGDGFLSINQNPVYSFVDSGIFNITLTAINTNGCEATDQSAVTVLTNPVVVVSGDEEICSGDSITLNASGAISYSWIPGIFLDDPGSSSPVAMPASTIEYTVTGFSANGCSNSSKVRVTVNPLPAVQTSEDAAICPGTSVQVTAGGGTGYFWSPPKGLDFTNTPSVIASPDTSTIYQVEVVNEYGCNSFDYITVVVYPESQLKLSGSGDICLGEQMSLNAEGAASYFWSPPTGLSCVTCENPEAAPNSDITYSVIATDIYGCIYSDSVAIVVRQNPEIKTIENITICKGESVNLLTAAISANSFQWSPPLYLDDATLLSPVAAPTDSITYVVTASNDYGCERTDTVRIDVIEEVKASLLGDNGVCNGQSVELELQVEQASSNGYSVKWIPANMFSNQNSLTQNITPANDVEITVIVSSKTCRSDTMSLFIKVHDLPDVYAGQDQHVYAGERVQLHMSSYSSIRAYNWFPSNEVDCYYCQTTSFIADLSTMYVATVFDENGCRASDSVHVKVTENCGDDIFVPNAFSPNGDEVNDKLFIRTANAITLKDFKVFDRWGNEVYSGQKLNEGWDGNYPAGWNGFNSNDYWGKDATNYVVQGVYVYYLTAGCNNGREVMKYGNVTVIR